MRQPILDTAYLFVLLVWTKSLWILLLSLISWDETSRLWLGQLAVETWVIALSCRAASYILWAKWRSSTELQQLPSKVYLKERIKTTGKKESAIFSTFAPMVEIISISSKLTIQILAPLKSGVVRAIAYRYDLCKNSEGQTIRKNVWRPKQAELRANTERFAPYNECRMFPFRCGGKISEDSLLNVTKHTSWLTMILGKQS